MAGVRDGQAGQADGVGALRGGEVVDAVFGEGEVEDSVERGGG